MEFPSEQQTILIVDDAKENIRHLAGLLGTEYTIRVATSGERALEILISDDQPDLVLLDVMMPGMDGYEVCRRAKANDRSCKIPIIFVTGKVSEEDEVEGFSAGAVDYVTKPFNPIIVKARVQTHAELKRHRDLLETLSYRDGLTGIANRRRFDEFLSLSFDFARRQESPLSLILIDIDDFKLFNDHYGHQLGDECLKLVAQSLAANLKRKTDLAARYGGEEFGCILPKTANSDAITIAEKLRQSVFDLQIPHAYSTASEWVTISLGLSTTTPIPDSNPGILLRAADQALYRSKSAGRNRLCIM
ncbi:MAG: diguanylate cyclase [Syntrophomonas sp.]